MAFSTQGRNLVDIAGSFVRLVGLAGAIIVSLATVTPAHAAGTVTQVINCGGIGNSLAASIADMTLTPMNFSTVAQDSPGTLTLAASEAGCLALGWNVTIQASEWARDGGGTAIPNTAFALTQVSSPTVVSGQAVSGLGGPKLVNQLGTLNQSRKVLQAILGFGVGSYSQNLGVKLSIPPATLPGTYKTTVTTTITVGP